MSDPLLKKKPYTPTSKSLAEVFLQYELEITGTFTAMVLLAYVLGLPLAEKCIFLSYSVGKNSYSKGGDDMYFVAFWMIAFTFLRAASMSYLFHPLSKVLGVTSFAKRQRLAEQGFMFTYYTISWVAGMYIMYCGPHWFNTAQYWIDYPHLYTDRKMKYYYLMQISLWFQQLYTIHIEKRRKDHYAMVAHHFITITLLVTSYFANFCRIGNAVLCCMDLADIILTGAKLLKYSGFTTVCDIAFGLFAIAWPITRHGFFTVIIWATITQPSRYLDMKWEPEKGKYFTPFTQKCYITLFLLLNTLMIYWFAMIIKVIVAVLKGNNAEDTRSDDEDDEPAKEKRKSQ